MLLKSEGYNDKTLNAYNSILINNIEYVQKIRGLNIVVFSKKKNMVIDRLYINSFKLTINR